MHVPHHGLADRVALIANDRALGHLHPLAFDRNPIGAAANVVGGAMSVRLIAAGHAVRRDHALEPGADIGRHVAELAPVDGERCASQYRKAGEQDEWRKPSHSILRCVVLSSRAWHPRFVSQGQFKRRRRTDARSNNERWGRRKFDAVRNQGFFLSRALAWSRAFTCDFGATFFHAIMSALFSVVASAFARCTLV